jgi:hypothetical protein
MIGKSSDRAERFFLAGASTGVSTGALGASFVGGTALALGNGCTSAVFDSVGDVIVLNLVLN